MFLKRFVWLVSGCACDSLVRQPTRVWGRPRSVLENFRKFILQKIQKFLPTMALAVEFDINGFPTDIWTNENIPLKIFQNFGCFSDY